MKYVNSFVIAVVIMAIAGCSTVIPINQQPTAIAPVRTPFGPGGAFIPPPPPGLFFSGQAGVLAPFADAINKITVKNDVRFRGGLPLIITRIWVAGVEVPVMRRVLLRNHVFTVNHLDIGDAQVINLPPSQFLDGTGNGDVVVVAQAESWRLDPMGRKVATGNIVCIKDTISTGEVEVLDWNHRMEKTIACPGQGTAS